METRDRILEIVKVRGPVLPVQIAKEIGSNILMASAHLAELTASKRLKISAIKVGGSPLYYLPGQEAMLQRYSANLNDKEKKAFDLLGQNKILRDPDQEPVIRVALREIKDFAIPLDVRYGDNVERFWKWHLTSDEEAEGLIKQNLEILEMQAAGKSEGEPIENAVGLAQKEAKGPNREKLLQTQKETKAKKEPRQHRQLEKEDNFLKEVMGFFGKSGINVISSETIKKGVEIDFIIEIESVVGNLQYYCKAKNKKRISDADLGNAYVRGHLKRLPVLLLAPGELSAKARELIGKELGNLTFKKI